MGCVYREEIYLLLVYAMREMRAMRCGAYGYALCAIDDTCSVVALLHRLIPPATACQFITSSLFIPNIYQGT